MEEEMNPVFITICIPAYKRIDFLRRLLDSIAIQKYRNFDVVVTDDSPDKEVQQLCELYQNKFAIAYFRNPKVLGTPENWNEGMRRAKGQWIKLMHDDDWFSHPGSLEVFAKAAAANDGAFIFSSYTNHYFSTGKEAIIYPSGYRLSKLKSTPESILSSNLVGPPSVTMHRNDQKIWYDRNIKWLVDIDYYIRRLKTSSVVHIKEPLVHVGLGEDQVTMMCHQKPEIEIPENLYVINKLGIDKLKNIMVYDAWWRLFRNLEIRSEDQLRGFHIGPWPAILLRILKDQRKWPAEKLKTGVISKLAMTLSYLKNYSTIK